MFFPPFWIVGIAVAITEGMTTPDNKQAGERTQLFEIASRGKPVYENERIIGYDGGPTYYRAVPEHEVELFLESYADSEDESVQVTCEALPQPFAAAPELLEACKSALAKIDAHTENMSESEYEESGWDDSWRLLSSAIAKAGGRA